MRNIAEATNITVGTLTQRTPLWAVREPVKGGRMTRLLGTKQECEAVAEALNRLAK